MLYYLGEGSVRTKMTTATMPRAVTMRPVESADDGLAATTLLALALEDDEDTFRALVPSGATAKPIEIAEDESAAVFDVYAGSGWDATNSTPIRRIAVRR